MNAPTRYVNGDWKAVCDICGQVYLGSQLKQRWDGYKVCPKDWEPRNPQDFVRAIPDTIAPPYTRPEAEDTYIFTCTIYTSSGVAGVGVAGCAQAGIDNGFRMQLHSSLFFCDIYGVNAIADIAVSDCAISDADNGYRP